MRKRVICFLSLIFLSLSVYSIFDEDKSKCVVIEKNEKVEVTFGENAERLIGYNPNEIIEKEVYLMQLNLRGNLCSNILILFFIKKSVQFLQ